MSCCTPAPYVNRVRRPGRAAGAGDVADLPERESAEGSAPDRAGPGGAWRAGELALVVLAGGMATRMGGVVKALVEAAPGVTFLDARLAERDLLAARAGGRRCRCG